MTKKEFRIPKEELRAIVTHRGPCIASDRITVDGAPVGYMYREPPDQHGSSGWCFMAGDESEAYCNDPERWGVYDVNTIANYDPGIVRFLDQPPGSAYVRNPQGKLERSRESSVPESKAFTIPDAQGDAEIDGHWSAHFPECFRRRIEGTDMVIGRPGLTFWMQGWETGEESGPSVRAKMERDMPPGARDVVREQDADSWRTLFRVDSKAADKRRPPLLGLIWSRGHVLQVSAYFDDESDLAKATAVLRSIRARAK